MIATRSVMLAALGLACAALEMRAQALPRRDTAAADSARVLAPITVSVTRNDVPAASAPVAVGSVTAPAINKAKASLGFDEALANVPGVYASNRFNFSLDQRISIRGFGARSSFGVRGIKVLLDGIPQTLPDGSGQLTNLELGSADRIDIVRGSSSALFGNASGGVISIRTDTPPPDGLVQSVRVLAGSFDRALNETWAKWQSTTRLRLGQGDASVSVSRLLFDGERQHSTTDFRNINARYSTPLERGLTLTLSADVGDDPRADNPGALTAAELAANPDSAAAINLTKHAGKSVTQYQAGATIRRETARGEMAFTVFGISRDLENPQTFAYISLHRSAYGVRFTGTTRLSDHGLRPRLTFGMDVQHQRDDRLNVGNQAGQPDTVRQLDQLEGVTEVGPFAQMALALGRRTMLTFGLRYDWVSFIALDRLITPTNPDDSGQRDMESLNGSVGVTRTVSDAVTVYANVGSSFETPTTTELANRPTGAGGFNPALGPQRAVNVEVGARGGLWRRFHYSIALFTAAVQDELIAYQVPAGAGRVFYQNAGRSRHQGVELGADAIIVPAVRLTATWTQSDFRYTDYTANGHNLDGRAVPGIPPQWLHFLWQVRPTFAHGAWLEIAQTHSSSFTVDDTLNTRTAAWWTTDVRVGWDGAIGALRLSPFVAVNNAWDKRYVSSVVINATGGRYYEPAPGRSVYIGLETSVGH